MAKNRFDSEMNLICGSFRVLEELEDKKIPSKRKFAFIRKFNTFFT